MPEIAQSIDARARLQAWARRQRKGAASRYAADQPAGLLEACFAILLQEAIGTAADEDRQWLQDAAKAIAGSQSEETGHFQLNEILPQDLTWAQACDANYIQAQCDYFALSALRAANVKVSHPLHFLAPFMRQPYAEGWLDAGPWQDPWNMSNRVMFLLRFYLEQMELIPAAERQPVLSLFDGVLDYLDSLQSPITGMWHGLHQTDNMTAAYAAYHFYPFYFFRGRRPHHIEKTIDQCLALQSIDGHFSSYSGGGACEDLDVIAILVSHSLASDHQQADVQKSLLKAHAAITKIQNPDGGFPNYSFTRNPKPGWKRKLASSVLKSVSKRAQRMSYYSGWKKTGSYFGQSDLWGGWFRIFAINLIESRFPHLFQERDATFHAYPCLGWHSDKAILTAST